MQPSELTAETGGRTFGYVRVSTDPQAPGPQAQREMIDAAARSLGRRLDGWFQDSAIQNPDGSWDDAGSGKITLPERQAGKELCAALRKGDLIIAARSDRIFRRIADCFVMLIRWERAGVSLHLCDYPTLGDLSDPMAPAMARAAAIFAELERKFVSQRNRESLSRTRRNGYCAGPYAEYGFKWERRYDKKRKKWAKVKVADHEERALMAEFVNWRGAGHNWETIVEHLRTQGVKTRLGTPWTRSRIQRAHLAELRLRTKEAGG